MKLDLLHLAIYGLGFLVLLAICALFLMRAQKQQQEFDNRVAGVLAPHVEGPRLVALAPVRLRENAEPEGIVGALCAMINYRPLRQVHYKIPLLLVLVVTLILALMAVRIVYALVGWPAMLPLPLVWIALLRVFYTNREQKLTDALFRQFPDALGMIVRSVRVGVPVSEAVRVVAREAVEPTSREFTRLSEQVSVGVPLDEALKDMAGRNGLPEYRFFATALALQAQTGGGLTETLENLADTIRKRVSARNRAYALASEARVSSYILGALPIVTGIALFFLNPTYISVLFNDSGGQAILALAIGMLIAGMIVMRVIIKKSLS